MRGLSSSTMDSAEEGAARLTRCKEMMDQILAAMKKLTVTVDFEANTALLRAANQAFYKPMDSDSASSNTKPANNNSTSSYALLNVDGTICTTGHRPQHPHHQPRQLRA